MKNPYSKLTVVILPLLIAFAVLSGSACSEGEPYQNGGVEAPASNCDDLVIARIGDSDILMADLLGLPQLYQMIQQKLINDEVLRQEMAQRGLVIDQDGIRKQVDDMMMMNGGVEAFLDANVDPSIPRELVLNDVNNYFTTMEMQKLIMHDEYAVKHGPLTREEAEQLWLENGDSYRTILSAELGIAASDVTIEMAWQKLEDEFRTRWTQTEMTPIMAAITESYDIQFYLRERIQEMESIDVPPMTDEGLVEEPEEGSAGAGLAGEETDEDQSPDDAADENDETGPE